MSSDLDSEPFFPREEKESTGLPVRQSSFLKSQWRKYAVHIILIVFYTVVSLAVIKSNKSCPSQPTAGPLADLDFSYGRRTFVNLTDNNPFTGPPSDELDNAWDDLLGEMNIRVSGEELAQNGQDTVALPQGGYLAWLGAHHELHCVVCKTSRGNHFTLCPHGKG